MVKHPHLPLRQGYGGQASPLPTAQIPPDPPFLKWGRYQVSFIELIQQFRGTIRIGVKNPLFGYSNGPPAYQPRNIAIGFSHPFVSPWFIPQNQLKIVTAPSGGDPLIPIVLGCPFGPPAFSRGER